MYRDVAKVEQDIEFDIFAIKYCHGGWTKRGIYFIVCNKTMFLSLNWFLERELKKYRKDNNITPNKGMWED